MDERPTMQEIRDFCTSDYVLQVLKAAIEDGLKMKSDMKRLMEYMDTKEQFSIVFVTGEDGMHYMKFVDFHEKVMWVCLETGEDYFE